MRLFVAIEIPDEIKERISGAARSFSSDGITLVKRDAYHITLQFLGNRDEEELVAIKDALSTIRFNGFDADMRGVSYFEPRFIKVIFAGLKEGSNEIKSMYNAIDLELASRIRYGVERDYTPHLTIARVKRIKDRDLLLANIEKYSDYEFGRFRVGSVVLKESVPTESGYVHRTLQEIKG